MKIKCSNCSKIFKSQLALRSHMKKHEKPHFCNVCKCRFTSKEEIEKHLLIHGINQDTQPHSGARYRGKKCYKKILSDKAIELNFRVQSGASCGDNKPKYTSKQRKRNMGEFDVTSELPNLASMTDTKDCDFNGTEIETTKEPCAEDILKYNEQLGASVSLLKEGNTLQTQISEKAKPFKHCDKDIEAHVENSSEECEMKYQTSCSKDIDKSRTNEINKPRVDQCTNKLDNKSEDSKCVTCNAFYNRQNSCTRCNCKASIGNEFGTEGRSNYFCMVCNKAYISLSTYTHHVCKSQDYRTRKKTCHVCDKSFKTNEHLRQHMRKHTGEKPYLCGSCGKSFSQQGNLIKHTRIHEGNRMFLCEICSRPFMTKSALNEHLLIHADEKAHNCGTCGKLFRHKHGLVHHLRNRKYPCNVRKYGERKLTEKSRKHACGRNIINDKKKQTNVSNLKKMPPSNDVIASGVGKLGLEDNFEKPDIANEMEENNDTNDVYRQIKSVLKTDANRIVPSSEHSIKKLKNFIEAIHPCSKIDNNLQSVCEYTMLEEKQNSERHEVPNKRTLIDKSKIYPSDRNAKIAEQCDQTLPSEKASNTHIDKILMQYYHSEISPVLYEKGHNTHAQQFGMESCKSAFNISLKTTETKLDSADPGLDEEHGSALNFEHRMGMQNPHIENDVSTSAESEPERLIFTRPLTGRSNLATETSDHSANLILPFQNPGKNTVDTETLKKRIDHLKSIQASDRNRIMHVVEENTTEIVSKVENEYSDFETIDKLQNKEIAREKDTYLNNTLSCDSMADSIGDNEYSDESEMSITEAHSQNQTNIAIHSESMSVSNKTTVEINEEEVLKIIEKARSKDFRCSRCYRKFSNEYCLSVHNCKVKTEKPKLERKQCDKCDKSYANKYLLASHSCKSDRKVNRISKQKQQECERALYCPLSQTNQYRETLCKTELETKSRRSLKNSNVKNRRRERNNKRSDNNQYQNMKVFEQERKLEKDCQHDVKLQYDACSAKEIVSAKITTQVTRNETTKTKCSNEDTMICETCGKSYKNKVNLKNHSCKPQPEEARTCKVCGKVFNVKIHLQIHMRIHTGELPFLCKICGKRFNQSANLMKHMRIHNPEKGFKCEICGRQFTQKGALTEHRVVHTNIKPYVCSKCNKSFRHKHGLQNHLSRRFPCDKKKKKDVDMADKGDKISIPDHEKDKSQTMHTTPVKWAVNNTEKGQNNCFKNDAIQNCHISDFERTSREDIQQISGSAPEANNPTNKLTSAGNEKIYYQTSNVQTLSETVKNTNGQSVFVDQRTHLPESIPVTKHNPESTDSDEIYIQQTHPGYGMSHGMPAGWITLNCRLVDL